MKIWIIVVVVAILAIVGIVAVNALQNSDAEVSGSNVCSTPDPAPVCGNSCTAGNVCSNPSCGVRTGSGCGCKG
tara:strand:+ start:152 stop:373 length:222 start_codon:yes stop_codon:yes gene_type:complete